jgi:hypothetical protein
MPKRPALLLLLALAACGGGPTADPAAADSAQAGSIDAPDPAAADQRAVGRPDAPAGAPAPSCLTARPNQVSGVAVGTIWIRDPVTRVRRDCDVVRDTTLRLEGHPQPALLVRIGTDTVVAEIVRGRVWRMTVRSPGLLAPGSLRVGMPVNRLADFPGARMGPGEGMFGATVPGLCGLGFGVGRVPGRRLHWGRDDLHALPDSITVESITVTGTCTVREDGRARHRTLLDEIGEAP